MRGTRKSAGIVSIAVMGSRVLGLIREVVFAALFGAGKYYDAYLGAFRIPNLLRDLFAEGALSTAFTTVFSKKLEKEGDVSAWKLASLMITILVVAMTVICLLGIAFADEIVSITNPGFQTVEGKFELTVRLTQILFPFIGFVSAAALVMGMLNAKMIFGIPASASSAFNFVSILGGVGLAYWFEPQENIFAPHFGERGLMGVCVGVLLGGMAQLLIQLPSLWRLGFRFQWSWDWKNPGLKEIGVLMIPSVIAASAVQVNVLINGIFASKIDGGVSWLNCAFRLIQFPIGVFGVAIATATLPAVARQQARQDLDAFGKTLSQSLRFMLFLTIPSAVGLGWLSQPIIQMIYEHGRFDAADTLQTSRALQAYLIGLVGYAGIKVLIPCFYALDLPRIPLRVSIMGIVLNLLMNMGAIYFLNLGHVGLAMSTGFLALINFLQLFFAMRQRIELGSISLWMQEILKMTVAAFLAVGVAEQGGLWIRDLGHSYLSKELLNILFVGSSIAIAGAIYLGLGWWMKMEEMTSLVSLIQRKFLKKSS